MGAPVVITLAGEPKGKGRPRFARATGRAFTPAATRSYEAALRYAAQEAMGDRFPIGDAVVVTVEARMPIPQSWSKKRRAEAAAGRLRATCKPDIDNLVKVIDALNEVVWVDDKQIVKAEVTKVYSDKPALVIQVFPLDGGE